jgi:hypothetical protein
MAAWDMQPDETSLSYRAFCIFRDLNPPRHYSDVLKALDSPGTTPQTLYNWGSEHNWNKRAELWDAYKDKKSQEAQIQKYIEMQGRHIQEARFLQQTGVEALQRTVADNDKINPQTSLQMIQAGQEQERKAMGLAENQQKAPQIAIIIHYDGKKQDAIEGEFSIEAT